MNHIQIYRTHLELEVAMADVEGSIAGRRHTPALDALNGFAVAGTNSLPNDASNVVFPLVRLDVTV